jgi:hypothetical protein
VNTTIDSVSTTQAVALCELHTALFMLATRPGTVLKPHHSPQVEQREQQAKRDCCNGEKNPNQMIPRTFVEVHSQRRGSCCGLVSATRPLGAMTALHPADQELVKLPCTRGRVRCRSVRSAECMHDKSGRNAEYYEKQGKDHVSTARSKCSM